MSDDGGIHYENPFATPAAAKTAGRSLRGRLTHPVTIWTARGPDGDVGLTMSSVLVADGEPPLILDLMAPTTDLFEVISSTKRFVLHVLGRKDWELADIFAGLRPNPGGPFEGLSPGASDYGPLLPSQVTAFTARCQPSAHQAGLATRPRYSSRTHMVKGIVARGLA